MHGRLSAVLHEDSPLFAGIPREFQVVRYHSLCVEQPLPEELEAIAWTSDGVLMARRPPPPAAVGRAVPPRVDLHRVRPPAAGELPRPDGRVATGRNATAPTAPLPTGRSPSAGRRVRRRGRGLQLKAKRLDIVYRPRTRLRPPLRRERRAPSGSTAAWSTSAPASRSWATPAARSRATITYDVADGEVRVERGGEVELHEESIFDYLSREMRRLRYLSDDLPFDFNCGFVGYFGYELKADCGGSSAHRSRLPDAALRLRRPDDRLRPRRGLHLRALPRRAAATAEEADALDRRDEPAARLAAADRRAGVGARSRPSATRSSSASAARTSSTSTTSPSCKRYLIDGETYEICLTNKITAEVSPDPLPLYRTLRRVNPAPFSAFLRFGEAAVLSSSPERFLSIGRDRWVGGEADQGHLPARARRRPRTCASPRSCAPTRRTAPRT